MPLIELKVPDIGDTKDVSVIELLVQPGDTIRAEQSLITVESDKASMEIPATQGGVVKELRVALGDKVSEGSVIAVVEAAGAASAPRRGADTRSTADTVGAEPVEASPLPPQGSGVHAPDPVRAEVSKPQHGPSEPSDTSGRTEEGAQPGPPPVDGTYDFDLLVLGAGPGGYSAAFRAADLGLQVALVERHATLGGVCLNVGCIPSKALLHVASVMDEARHFESLGVVFGQPTIDLDKLRAHKSKVVGKLTQGLAAMAKMRKVTVFTGAGEFMGPHRLKLTPAGKPAQTLSFARAIIAAGSEAVKLPFLPKNDPRIVTSTGALELRQLPKRMLVIGGGIIGLEMGTVYSTLGARLDVVEMLDGLMQGADRDLVKVWQKHNAHRFDHVMLRTKTVGAEATNDGIRVSFEGEGAPKEPQLYDLVLQAVGRTPNGQRIGAQKAGVQVGERGFIPVDIQMRTNVPHIFAIGDIVGQPMLAHKAVHEGHVAAEVAAGEHLNDDALKRAAFEARVIPSVAYTDPEVAWVGLTEDEARAQGVAVTKGLFPWSASGRAIANTRDEGFTKLLFDAETRRIVGGGIVGTHAGDLISEIGLAIEMGADAVDIGKTIHPHPTLGESIGLAAEAAEGHCTDLPPARAKR